jgi:hypothetical protein
MQERQQQPYDTTLKALLREQAAEMIPYLVEEAEFVDTLDSEVLKPQPPLRADRAYKILYRGEPHVFHFELETGANSRMAYRMLSYHALLLEEQRLPVISLVIYPFRTKLPVSPLRETSRQNELLVFHFKVLALWELEAKQYLKEHVVSMYPLLPTMKGANASMLLEAVDELKQHYDETNLGRRLLWLRTLLERVKTLPQEDKSRVEERLHMFDSLLEDDPYIQERENRAEARGETRALQQAVVEVVQVRFPTLEELAQQTVTQVSRPDALHLLIKQISAAPDEVFTRQLLGTLAA